MPTLRDLRQARGLSQADVAARAGLRQATLSALEGGRSRPRRATLGALAAVLGVSSEAVAAACRESQAATGGQGPGGLFYRDWAFLVGLDADLRRGLVEELVATWTHSSTALEGNTISQGDTLFVLREGLTVGGHSLREHEELHGHAGAIARLDHWLRDDRPLRISDCHDCHRLIQTGVVIDIFQPVGAWKVEANGTQAITSDGRNAWHDYAAPEHVPALMDVWLGELDAARRSARGATPESLLEHYLVLHLGLAAIHPYADGNGRLARLLANLPILAGGRPPILVPVGQRRRYLQLMGDHSLTRGAPRPGEALVPAGATVDALRTFFADCWQPTLALVETWHRRQQDRESRRNRS